MKKRRTIVLTVCAVLLAGALAQDTTSIETRLSLLESRVGRIEIDVAKLEGVPVSLSRIETQLEALVERTSGQGNVLQTVGLGIIMSVVTGVVTTVGIGRKNQK